MYRVLNMFKASPRDAKLPCQNDLIAQCNDFDDSIQSASCAYEQNSARLLLSRSKKRTSVLARIGLRAENRLERAAKLNERPASLRAHPAIDLRPSSNIGLGWARRLGYLGNFHPAG